jgi:hypothetical protein
MVLREKTVCLERGVTAPQPHRHSPEGLGTGGLRTRRAATTFATTSLGTFLPRKVSLIFRRASGLGERARIFAIRSLIAGVSSQRPLAEALL